MHLNMCCMPENTLNISRYVLTKPVSYPEERKMHLNLFDQKLPMPAKTQNVYQFVLTKPFPFMRRQNIYLNMR